MKQLQVQSHNKDKPCVISECNNINRAKSNGIGWIGLEPIKIEPQDRIHTLEAAKQFGKVRLVLLLLC